MLPAPAVLSRHYPALARACGVRLHTHLAESDNDVAYSLAHFGCTPAQYADDTGWTGAHVWHAHCVKLISDPMTGVVLGGSIVGRHAAELISVIALAVTAGLTVADLDESLFVHPSLAEALAEAAE